MDAERDRGASSTFFLLAGHGDRARRRRRRRCTSGCGRASWRRSSRAAARSGCTGATSRPTILERLAAEMAALGEPGRRGSTASATTTSASTRTRTSRRFPSSASATTRRSASRTRQASAPGIAQPFRPWDFAADRPLDLVEIPLAAMDVTLGEERYLGLSARRGARAAARAARLRGRARRRLRGAVAHGPLRPGHRARLGPPLLAAARRRARARRRLPLRGRAGGRARSCRPELRESRRVLAALHARALGRLPHDQANAAPGDAPARARVPAPGPSRLRERVPPRPRTRSRPTRRRSGRAGSSSTSGRRGRSTTRSSARPGATATRPAAIGLAERTYLYAILRTLKPRVAVETGVANGFSTAFALLALERNGEGQLYSIDFPREIGKDDGRRASTRARGRPGSRRRARPGWLVPDDLRERWTLRLGRSQDELPPLLESLGDDRLLHARQRALVRLHVVRVHERLAAAPRGRRARLGRRQLDRGVPAASRGRSSASRSRSGTGWRSSSSDGLYPLPVLSAKRILVTGGAGFISSNVVRHLLETTPYEVVSLDALTYAGNMDNLEDVTVARAALVRPRRHPRRRARATRSWPRRT